MTKHNTLSSLVTIGLDVGDSRTHFCVLGDSEKPLRSGSFETTPESLMVHLSTWQGARVILEAGSQSPWMSRALTGSGFDTHVCDPRSVKAITADPRKSDKRDARMLARLGAQVPDLIGKIHHRGEQAQADLSIVRARDLVVRMRTSVVQQIRGLCKAFGLRLGSASTSAFGKKLREFIPAILRPALNPILELLENLNSTINGYDRLLAAISAERYPEIAKLQKITGVGPVTATAFVLTLENPHRFGSGRRVGSWLGLCPRNQASGNRDPDLPISKTGDSYLRRLLVQCAHCIVSRGKSCDLKRFGQRLSECGRGACKRKVIVAVARKLAVTMHAIWRSGFDFDTDFIGNQKITHKT